MSGDALKTSKRTKPAARHTTAASVCGSGDRAALTDQALARASDGTTMNQQFTASAQSTAVALLLPAVQMAREAA
jgi:hypothetical protein